MRKDRVEVSPEMLSYVGPGAVEPDWPASWVVLLFSGLADRAPCSVACVEGDGGGLADDAALVFAVDPAAFQRLYAVMPTAGAAWHLPSQMRAIALAICDCAHPEPARATMRLAKSIELLCAVALALKEETLVPCAGVGALSEGDAARILAARRLVDERWREKLTLDAIARACGLNRAKLTRGFRLLFDCSVADALAANRLGGARRMLRETDLPVSSIGYACGYRNNASFTRAFSRRYGVAPTHVRRSAAA